MGDILGSIGDLERLIADHGETSERLGLLGGRYKRLVGVGGSPSEQAVNLGKAIAAYQRGMEVDLNDYYPTSIGGDSSTVLRLTTPDGGTSEFNHEGRLT